MIVLLIILSENALGQLITLQAQSLINSVQTTTQYKYYGHPKYPTRPLNIYNYELTFVNNQNQNFVLNCKSGHSAVLFLGDVEHVGNLMMSPNTGHYYTFELEKVCVNDISCKNNFYIEFCMLQTSNCSLIVPNPTIIGTNNRAFYDIPQHVEYNGELYLLKKITTNDNYNWDILQGQGFDFRRP